MCFGHGFSRKNGSWSTRGENKLEYLKSKYSLLQVDLIGKKGYYPSCGRETGDYKNDN
jgi:hypothetical protein